MITRQERVGESEVVQHLERGRMHGIAPERPVEVISGLEQRSRDTLACKEQGEDRSGRPSSDDAAASGPRHGERNVDIVNILVVTTCAD